jgi:aryl-alcohol dehydrogenase-like predicted oxidoreductase
MEYRQLGGSGLQVPALAFGTATFGGGNAFFRIYPYWHQRAFTERNPFPTR